MQVTFDKKQEKLLNRICLDTLLSKNIYQNISIKDLAKSDKIRKYLLVLDRIKLRKLFQVGCSNSLNLMIIVQEWLPLNKINLKVIDQAQIIKAMEKAILMLRMMLPVQWQKSCWSHLMLVSRIICAKLRLRFNRIRISRLR